MKKTVTTKYVCEVCNYEWDNETDALTCESYGVPEIYPWLKLGVKLPVFGENGILFTKIKSIYIENRLELPGEHDNICNIDYVHISHNFHDDRIKNVPQDCFHPYKGWDFMRYKDDLKQIEEWYKICKDYNLVPDLIQCSWFFDFSPKSKKYLELIEELKRKEND